MRFDIRYRCTFTYDELVRESQNELRACPASADGQHLVSYRVGTAPSCRILSFTDYWGTRVDAFGVRTPHLALEVVADASVETRRRPRPTSVARPHELRHPAFVDAHIEYLGESPHVGSAVDVARAAAQGVGPTGDDVVGQVLTLHRLVGARLQYVPGSTYVGVAVDEVFARGKGVCQDYAHLAIGLCRSVGIPARYVSGYLFAVEEPARQEPAPETESVSAETVLVQTHAWFEAAIPGFGWLALDPTNQEPVGLRHVKIGHGRDYDDVTPLHGVYSGQSGSDVRVSVEIRKLHESPAAVDPFAMRAVTPTFGERRAHDLGFEHQQHQQQ